MRNVFKQLRLSLGLVCISLVGISYAECPQPADISKDTSGYWVNQSFGNQWKSDQPAQAGVDEVGSFSAATASTVSPSVPPSNSTEYEVACGYKDNQGGDVLLFEQSRKNHHLSFGLGQWVALTPSWAACSGGIDHCPFD